MMKTWIIVAVSAVALLADHVALAQVGGLQADAVSGNWIGLHHSENDISTDVCMATSVNQKLIFRADKDSVELRTVDPSWSLTVGSTGPVTVTVGKYKKDLALTALDATMLGTTLAPEDAQAMFDAMDTASTASLAFGTKTHETVSLIGSTKVINAFRACSASSGFANLGQAAGKPSGPF